jgi:hypothetical protein
VRGMGKDCSGCVPTRRRYDRPMREAIFIAANVAEAQVVEQMLAAERIEFDITPEPFLQQPSSNVCLQGLLFEVVPGQAEYCRRLLRDRGLARGVIPAESGTGRGQFDKEDG